MTLFERLKLARSEEDVKDAYIKALGLKSYQKGLIDIQTKEIWFEAKDKSNTTTYKMLTQLLHYVKQWMEHGEEIPPFLCAIDTEKAAIMKTTDALPLFERKDIKWGKSASDVTPEALEAVSTFIGTRFVSYRIATHEQEFIDAVKNAIKNGDIIRTEIKPANIKSVFDKWVDMIGKEIDGVAPEDYALLFFADIMHDGTVSTHKDLPAQLLYRDGQPVFLLGGKIYELGNKEGYRQFWAIYHKPPREENRNAMLERRDTLIPLDERSFKGAYYTPLHVVDKAYEKLTETLGDNWQDEYIVWDMCCGVGNLEIKHSNPRNIYMSTLDQADVDVMKATKTCVAATRFQYDYLNDDITDEGKIDYNLTNKIPKGLRKAIKSGKKILVLINPPYAEASNAGNTGLEIGEENKTGVANTKIGNLMRDKNLGYAARELFVQFLSRISQEIPSATIGMFSTMKYVNAPNFEKFRNFWSAEHLAGFVFSSKVFDGLSGNFPIGFNVWQTSQNKNQMKSIQQVSVEVLSVSADPVGEKVFFNLPNETYLTHWIPRLKTNTSNIPLKNAVAVQNNHAKVTSWIDSAIGYMYCNSNDIQHATQQTVIYSSVYAGGNGYYITPDNLDKISIVFSARQLTKHTWINHNDQFLQPAGKLTHEFKNDCLVFMLFHSKNVSASANDLKWNDKKWSIVNHFIPYTEAEVGSPERFESDFLVRYIANKEFSLEATSVLAEGKKLWSAYFTHTDPYTVREELKLNRPDVGWYQIRNALKKRNESGDCAPVSFVEFETAYKLLSEKLRPMVYSLGFLRE